MAALPVIKIAHTPPFNDADPVTGMRSVCEVVNKLLRLPGPDPRGLENDDGAHGDFPFDVAERSITLRYNERFTASTYHQHTF